MCARQAAEFATSRPSYWAQVAYDCYSSFPTYMVFVRGLLPADHHWVIIERLLYGDRLELILGPPDVAKTTYGVGFAEWKLGRNPNYRWLVASEVATGIATTIVSEIGSTIELNERFHFVFGALKDPAGRQPWSTHSITLRSLITPALAPMVRQQPTPPPPWPWLSPRGRDLRLTGKHPSVRAVGWRVGYAGARADGLLADDIVADRLSRSEKLTTQVYETVHQKLLPRLTGGDQKAVFFGQHFGPRDFYDRIRQRGVVVFDNNPNREGMAVLDRSSRRARAAA